MATADHQPAMTYLTAPPQIERAARAYLAARDAMDAAWRVVDATTRRSEPHLAACQAWARKNERCVEARQALRDAFDGHPGRYRIGDSVVEMSGRVTRNDPLVVRRIEPA